MKKKISITIDKELLNSVDSLADGIYIRNRSQAIEKVLGSYFSTRKNAVILAGGSKASLTIDGKTLRLETNVNGKPVIVHAVKKLREEGFREIHIAGTGYAITKAFEILNDGSSYGVNIKYMESRKQGTANNLRVLKEKLRTNFLVVYSDILFSRIDIIELWNAHMLNKGTATLMLTTWNNPKEKGTVEMSGNRITSFNQKSRVASSYLVFSPVFVCSPEIFEYKGASLEKEIFPLLAQKGRLHGYVSSEKEIHIHSRKDAERVVL